MKVGAKCDNKVELRLALGLGQMNSLEETCWGCSRTAVVKPLTLTGHEFCFQNHRLKPNQPTHSLLRVALSVVPSLLRMGQAFSHHLLCLLLFWAKVQCQSPPGSF